MQYCHLVSWCLCKLSFEASSDGGECGCIDGVVLEVVLFMVVNGDECPIVTICGWLYWLLSLFSISVLRAAMDKNSIVSAPMMNSIVDIQV
jgi:hypothetical protein